MELVLLWTAIRRRKWIIILTMILVFLGVAIGTQFVTPLFEATAKLAVRESRAGRVNMDKTGITSLLSMISATPNVDLNRILGISRPYIDEMIFRLQLRDDRNDLLNAEDLTRSRVLSRGRDIVIRQVYETDVLQISAGSPDPEEAKMMANSLAEIMVDNNQIQLRAEYRSAMAFLKSEMDKVKKSYDKSLKDIADFQKRAKSVSLEAETVLAIEKMAELMQQKEDNIIDLAEVRAKRTQLEKQLAMEGPESVSSLAMKQNPQIEFLKTRLAELRIQLSKLRTEFTEEYPQTVALKEQISEIQAELKKEIEFYRSSEPTLIQLDRQVAALEAHLEGVNANIDYYSKVFETLPDKALEQAGLKMELNVAQSAYTALLESLYQTGVAEATTLSTVKIIEPAIEPISAKSPRKGLHYAIGLFVGLVSGLGFAFLKEYMDETIRTPKDLQRFKSIPLLGVVFKRKRMVSLLTVDPNDPLFESYRKIQMHINVIGQRGDRPLQSFLVTSCAPGEGKTATVTNLAIAACKTGKKVLAIDSDLRRPCLNKWFKLPNNVGLADILGGECAIDEAIQETALQGLSIISSGTPSPDPGKLFVSGNMKEVIANLKEIFDLIFIDTAPMLVKSDPLVLSEYVDGSIVVVESAKTTARAVGELVGMITKADIDLTGFILNKKAVEKGKFYYHHYYEG